jgi:uracil-DNA glycosylase
MATVHPSSLLRAPDEVTRRREVQRFMQDLKKVAEIIKKRKVA